MLCFFPLSRRVASIVVLALTIGVPLAAIQPLFSAHPHPQPTAIAPAAPGTNALQSTLDALNPTWRATEGLAGFSSAGTHYLYLESSRDTGAGVPTSTLQLVDLATNRCLPNSCLQTHYRESDAPRSLQDSEASLLATATQARQTGQLMELVPGQRLEVRSRSRTQDGQETVTFALPSGIPVEIQLRQHRVPHDIPQAALQLTVRHQGKTQVLGSLQALRPQVLDYSLRAVHLAPDGQHLAIWVTALQPTFEGTLGTTWVQGLRLE